MIVIMTTATSFIVRQKNEYDVRILFQLVCKFAKICFSSVKTDTDVHADVRVRALTTRILRPKFSATPRQKRHDCELQKNHTFVDLFIENRLRPRINLFILSETQRNRWPPVLDNDIDVTDKRRLSIKKCRRVECYSHELRVSSDSKRTKIT